MDQIKTRGQLDLIRRTLGKSRAENIKAMGELQLALKERGVLEGTRWMFGADFDFESIETKRGPYNPQEPFRVSDLRLGDQAEILIRMLPVELPTEQVEIFIPAPDFLIEMAAGNIQKYVEPN